jgi:hypothetical protein
MYVKFRGNWGTLRRAGGVGPHEGKKGNEVLRGELGFKIPTLSIHIGVATNTKINN